MKIYFAGSIQAGRQDQELYKKLIAHLGNWGTVLTHHVGDPSIGNAGEALEHSFVHDRDMRWLQECDVVVAEVTIPSLGVGYEIAKGEEWGKPILCIFRTDTGRTLSSLIDGSNKLVVKRYADPEEGMQVMDEYLGRLRK